jgi:hypothetical protein
VLTYGGVNDSKRIGLHVARTFVSLVVLRLNARVHSLVRFIPSFVARAILSTPPMAFAGSATETNGDATRRSRRQMKFAAVSRSPNSSSSLSAAGQETPARASSNWHRWCGSRSCLRPGGWHTPTSLCPIGNGFPTMGKRSRAGLWWCERFEADWISRREDFCVASLPPVYATLGPPRPHNALLRGSSWKPI